MPGGSTFVSLQTFERDPICPQKVGYFFVAPAEPAVITPASNDAFGGAHLRQYVSIIVRPNRIFCSLQAARIGGAKRKQVQHDHLREAPLFGISANRGQGLIESNFIRGTWI
jgi:hypothetical protein